MNKREFVQQAFLALLPMARNDIKNDWQSCRERLCNEIELIEVAAEVLGEYGYGFDDANTDDILNDQMEHVSVSQKVFLNMNVDKAACLRHSARRSDRLHKSDIHTMQDILKAGVKGLGKLSYFGETTIQHLKEEFKQHGFELR